MELEKYSMGIGDRFGHQGKAQLSAIAEAAAAGQEICPVWNKSFREHRLVGSKPADVRIEADEAARALGWKKSYRVDADHVGLATVDNFIEPSDFFTIDVADFIGKSAPAADIDAFVKRMSKYVGKLSVPGLSAPLSVTNEALRAIASRYLLAAKEAGKVYRHVAEVKGADNFITEVSMDETSEPQTPLELLFILAALGDEKLKLATVAPKFPGRFNKGMDYVGDVPHFEEHFDALVCVTLFAAKEFGLPSSLKMSIHTGSDKFSLYRPMARIVRKHGTGIHLKTAGTTWLEELVGICEVGGAGLELAKEVYAEAVARFDELVGPFLEVISIDRSSLPSAKEVGSWSGQRLAKAIRHEPGFDPNFRQLFHVAFKIAAEKGERFYPAVANAEKVIFEGVKKNLFERHIRPMFLDK